MFKRMRIISILLIVFLFNNLNVKASCTEEQKKAFQSKLDQVSITYKYENELLDQNNNVITGFFSINITGLTEDLALYNPERNLSLVGTKDGNFSKFGFVNGTYEFRLFVNNNVCNDASRNITIKLPKYNEFSDNYLCNGIDATKFLPCSKWYEYDLDEKTFLARLEEYKQQTKKNNNVIEQVTEEVTDFFKVVSNHISDYLIWYIIGLLIIILSIVYLIYYIKKRKKGNVKWK